ncbi:hypothetical protein VTO73DRAFT_12958 [Trametes versicolor]
MSVAAGSQHLLLYHFRVRHSNCSPYLNLAPRIHTTSVGYVAFAPPKLLKSWAKLIDQPTDTGTISGISSSSIVVQPSMESCRLPIELCEAVMNTLRDRLIEFEVYRDHAMEPPARFELGGGCGIFGTAVTELVFTIKNIEDFLVWALGSLLKDSFPALRSVKITTFNPDTTPYNKFRGPFLGQPLLHAIALGRPVPGTLKTIVLDSRHHRRTITTNDCCNRVVGTSEEVVGSEKLLPELLVGLAELTIRNNWIKIEKRCAAYISSILPGMRNALRFE